MNEIQRITTAYQDACERREPIALATVVAVRGSAYRRPGARMLIGSDGRSAGSVSGGCLERDVLRQASRVLSGHAPILSLYDSTDEDLAEGFALGCNGAVLVLVERVEADVRQQMAFHAACLQRRVRGAVATVYASGGHPAVRVGARVMMTAGEAPSASGIAECELRARLERALVEALHSGRGGELRIEAAGGALEALVEVLDPPLQVVLFGAGHDAVPLVHFGRTLGWSMSVVAPVGGYGVRQRFAGADAIHVGRPEDAVAALKLGAESAAVLMSHNFPQDLAALRALLPVRPRYIGLLGPRRRAARMLDELAATGASVDESLRARIHGPVGLDIGAETPEEVALAIAAEIRAVTLGRDGRQARLRAAPLHDALQVRSPTAECHAVYRQGEFSCGLETA